MDMRGIEPLSEIITSYKSLRRFGSLNDKSLS